MSTLRFLGISALVLGTIGLAGCDADGDGLSNGKEKKLGSDPDVEDSDGDGLLDGEEYDLDLDPTNPDSDGDGYSDGIEIAEGTDPADASSGIYEGGWPFNPDKDDLGNPGMNRPYAVGEKFPRLVVKDQFREDVDLYDFAGHGKPILIDISAQWCGPCQAMADWLEGGPPGSFQQLNNVRRAVNQGDIYWITFMAQDATYGNATVRTVEEWDEAFPNENIAVLVDREQQLSAWLDLAAFPSTILLNPDMTIEVWDPNNASAGLAELSARLDQ